MVNPLALNPKTSNNLPLPWFFFLDSEEDDATALGFAVAATTKLVWGVALAAAFCF